MKNRRKRKILLTVDSEAKLSLEKEFELREKRLKLTYKILYVVAVGWAGLLLAYINIEKTEKMLCGGMLAILTTLLFRIFSYVFHEFRCLNVFEDTDDQTKEMTDYKFQDIWNGFGLSCFIAVLLVTLNAVVPNFITIWTLGLATGVGSFVLLVRSCLSLFLPERMKKVKRWIDIVAYNVVIPALCYAFFAIDQLA